MANPRLTHKAGATFSKVAVFRSDGVPLAIPSGAVVRCQVRRWPLRAGDSPLADAVVTVADQSQYPGQVTIYVDASVTATWPTGEAALDVAVELLGDRRLTRTVLIGIEPRVTL